ncbi:transcriptional regulator NrdR [Effusibacillus dendaii]|uniref:Transcriptional repressor NrdR n=1 Tax=Effusibacillus dendaii TaxID=2743772 RepID=A0A7I8DDT9_9BACL|nr:transcriptional regulator NrdR [Effusibacillus dendaii]BCJ88265.1 transcriptional repressor NrdR [Effusibacillus dendaii]
MRCPYCYHNDSRVLESRASEDHASIRRRRECPACLKRFTTYEKVEMAPLLIIKKDNRREEFSREKLLRGILKACEKRPIAMESIEQAVDAIEREIRSEYDKEVPAERIGEKVMEKLRAIDAVAYVRFASVYRQFRDVETFAQEILHLLDSEKIGGKKHEN